MPAAGGGIFIVKQLIKIEVQQRPDGKITNTGNDEDQGQRPVVMCPEQDVLKQDDRKGQHQEGDGGIAPGFIIIFEQNEKEKNAEARYHEEKRSPGIE